MPNLSTCGGEWMMVRPRGFREEAFRHGMDLDRLLALRQGADQRARCHGGLSSGPSGDPQFAGVPWRTVPSAMRCLFVVDDDAMKATFSRSIEHWEYANSPLDIVAVRTGGGELTKLIQDLEGTGPNDRVLSVRPVRGNGQTNGHRSTSESSFDGQLPSSMAPSVIIVDDFVGSGETLRVLIKCCRVRGVSHVRVVCLTEYEVGPVVAILLSSGADACTVIDVKSFATMAVDQSVTIPQGRRLGIGHMLPKVGRPAMRKWPSLYGDFDAQQGVDPAWAQTEVARLAGTTGVGKAVVLLDLQLIATDISSEAAYLDPHSPGALASHVAELLARDCREVFHWHVAHSGDESSAPVGSCGRPEWECVDSPVCRVSENFCRWDWVSGELGSDGITRLGQALGQSRRVSDPIEELLGQLIELGYTTRRAAIEVAYFQSKIDDLGVVSPSRVRRAIRRHSQRVRAFCRYLGHVNSSDVSATRAIAEQEARTLESAGIFSGSPEQLCTG